jgi:hypothetical protein
MNAILVICAWCDKFLGKKPSDREIESIENSINHGMCQECHDEVLDEMNQFDNSEE